MPRTLKDVPPLERGVPYEVWLKRQERSAFIEPSAKPVAVAEVKPEFGRKSA